MRDILTKKPFELSEEGADWVENTYASMTIEERIGQLFCPIVFTGDPKELEELVKTKHVGGVLYREGKGTEIQGNHRILQQASKVPLMTAANLECGGTGTAVEGTDFGRAMLVDATDSTS